MDAANEEPPVAWQPLTPAGIAAFAHATTGRLLLVQLVFAIVAAASITWFLSTCWFPIISEAIRQMPAGSQIRSGKLDWRGPPRELLSEGRFLSIAVDLDHKGEARSPSHLHVEFGESDVKIFSILGYFELPYIRWFTLAFDRNSLEPWWGAWAPPILAVAFGGVIACAGIAWALLAVVYSFPVSVLGFFADRDLNLARSRRLAGAALMPGALFMSLCVVLYGCRLFDIPKLAMAFALHLVIGWGFVIVSPFYVLRAGTAAPSLKENPFAGRAKE